MEGAFNGKFLRVDLSSGTTAVEEVPVLVYRMYLGGNAMAAYFLAKELKPGVDPLGPDNILVFATGPCNGSPLSGTNRFTAAAKSPLTGGYGEGEAGGWWGPELKFAGFDGLIVTGQSPKPVYLWISDGTAELRDAAHLWGKPSGEVQDLLTAETDKRARILQCGPAGEKGVRLANMVNELKHFIGRSGLGAVMGSKRLRAIAVRGHGKLAAKDPQGVQAVLKWFREHYNRDADMLHKYGTSRNIKGMNADGILPSYNFQKGQFEQCEADHRPAHGRDHPGGRGHLLRLRRGLQARGERARAGGHVQVRRPRVRDHRGQRLGLRRGGPQGHRQVPPDLR